MPVESDADRAAFFDPDEFGKEAQYRTALGASATINGMLMKPSIDVAMGNIVAVDAAPIFVCRTIDLPVSASGGAGGDELEIGAEIYLVVSIKSDGTGLTRLELGK